MNPEKKYDWGFTVQETTSRIGKVLIDHLYGFTIGTITRDGKIRIRDQENREFEITVEKVR